MIGWVLLTGTAVAAFGSLALVLFPPLPKDLGGAEDLDHEAERRRIPVPGDGHLDAWYLRGHRPAAVAIFHGFGRTHHRAWRYAGFLRRLGVHVVTVDFRSSRWPDRRPTTLGHHEREDVEAVLDWMLRAPELQGCRIGFLGESLGGAVALHVASQRPDVSAIVVDGAFASSVEALEDSCERFARIPRQPSATILRAIGRTFTGYDPGHLSPLAGMAGLRTRPVFFIHGTEDDRIAPGQAQALWQAAGAKDPLWILEGVGHNQAWSVRRDQYERHVSAFFERHLLDCGPGVPPGAW